MNLILNSDCKIVLDPNLKVELHQLEVGDFYLGGVIAYIANSADTSLWVPGETHGIVTTIDSNIASELWDDMVTGKTYWGCQGHWSYLGATGRTVGTGYENTQIIYRWDSGCTNPTSSLSHMTYLCKNYTIGGYNDWFIPSLDEMKKIHLSTYLYPGKIPWKDPFIINDRGTIYINQLYWWTSSEISATKAYNINLYISDDNNPPYWHFNMPPVGGWPTGASQNKNANCLRLIKYF